MTPKKLHIEAMQKSQLADIAIFENREQDAMSLWKESFELEKQAAMLLMNKYDKEPTRSILFKSAAYLALKVGLKREAEFLACRGLEGSPSEYVAKELKRLKVNRVSNPKT